MKIDFEVEMNRDNIYNENGAVIGETIFVVPMSWLRKIFDKHYCRKYDSFGNFIVDYVPEDEGEYIYRKAKRDNVLKHDYGVVMY